MGFAGGSWSHHTCRKLLQQLQHAVQQPDYRHKLEVYSDGNDDYTIVLPEYFHKDSLCYGQMIKVRKGRRVVDIYRRKIFGNTAYSEINTSQVECFNSVLRGKLSRLVRKSKDHSKAVYELDSALGFFRFWWNFLHARDGTTAAMREGLTHKKWGWRTFLHAKITDTN